MSNKVRVYNANVHPLKEMFKGDEVYLEAQDYWRDKHGKIREMDIYEATDFKGQYHPVPFDGSGKMIQGPEGAKHYKMIRLEPVGEPLPVSEEEVSSFRCMAPGCKHVAANSDGLDAHARTMHPGIENLILPEEDQRLRQKAKAKA